MTIIEEELQNRMNEVLEDVGLQKVRCCKVATHYHLAYFDLQWPSSVLISRLEQSLREIAIGIKSKTTPIIKIISDLGIVRLQVAMKAADPIDFKSIYQLDEIPQHMVFPMCLGINEDGKKLWMDMARNPHLLIAGGTGSGKSTLLHTIIANAFMLMACNYRDVEIDLVDPKRIEFCVYANSQLLSTYGGLNAVHYTYEDTVELLKNTAQEMEERYEYMSENGVKNSTDAFALKLIVIDEIADLILQDENKKLAKLLVMLAQKGRAAGIHIILATQRPSVDVLTGVIKANFPGRIACKTASKTDSKVILDEVGAEHLLGRGDAIIRNLDFDRDRFQVAYISDSDVVDHFNNIQNCYLEFMRQKYGLSKKYFGVS